MEISRNSKKKTRTQVNIICLLINALLPIIKCMQVQPHSVDSVRALTFQKLQESHPKQNDHACYGHAMKPLTNTHETSAITKQKH